MLATDILAVVGSFYGQETADRPASTNREVFLFDGLNKFIRLENNTNMNSKFELNNLDNKKVRIKHLKIINEISKGIRAYIGFPNLLKLIKESKEGWLY